MIEITFAVMLLSAIAFCSIYYIDKCGSYLNGPKKFQEIGKKIRSAPNALHTLYLIPIIAFLIANLLPHALPEIWGTFEYFTTEQNNFRLIMALMMLLGIPPAVLIYLRKRDLTNQLKAQGEDILSTNFEKALEASYNSPDFNQIMERAFSKFESSPPPRFLAREIREDYERSKANLLNRNDSIGIAFKNALMKWKSTSKENQ